MASYRPFQTVGVIYTATEKNSVPLIAEMRTVGLKLGFTTVERPFRMDANKKVTVEGAADLVRQIKDARRNGCASAGLVSRHAVQGCHYPAAMAQGCRRSAPPSKMMENGALSGW